MITSRQNSKLKTMRRLKRCKGEGLLLEGPRLVQEALEAGVELEAVLATPEFLESAEGRRLASLLPAPPDPIEPQLLEPLADTDSPRGLVAAARKRRGRLEDVPVRPGGVYVYTEGMQDPGNLGALVRVAEASGVTALVLAPGTVDPHHPRAVRGSAGSLLRSTVATNVSAEALQRHLAEADPRWLALVPRGGRDLYDDPLEGTLVLALGAEGPGLSADLEERAERRLTIPLAEPVESLNATVAASVVLFEIRRRRR